MKSKLLVLLLLAGGSVFAGTRVFVGFGAGGGYYPGYYAAPPPAPRVAYAPRYARPGYVWVDGYHYPVGSRWVWRSGYWARRPYPGAYWVAPRYYNHRYYGGYWHR